MFSTIGGGKVDLATELVERSLRSAEVALRFQTDFMAGIMGPVITPLSRVLDIPSCVF
ncbi:MAG: hypothetical protein AAGA56_27655 [Myxococcota bacterium]